MLNGFPKSCSHRNCSSFRGSQKPKQNYSSFTTLPYIKGVSDKIQRILHNIGVKVAFKPYLTINKYLPSPKDFTNKDELSGMIYQVPCHDCDFIYIGQTKRTLKSRLNEHKRSIKYQRPEQSALADHSMSMDHKINWEEAKILKLESDYFKRLFTETWYINSKSHVMNRNDGNSFPSVYYKLL